MFLATKCTCLFYMPPALLMWPGAGPVSRNEGRRVAATTSRNARTSASV